MSVPTFSVLFLLIALSLVIGFATGIFLNGYVRPRTAYTYLIVSTILSSLISLVINIDVPN